MYHHLNHNNNNLNSSRNSLPSERNLFLQAGSGPGDSGLVLSTDAKPRLKWTPELHSRFVEAVKQLGGAEKATPKTVMRLMGIPGVTLYHLKSHLQKYRLSKNIPAQTNGGAENNVKLPTAASDKTSLEGNGLLVNNINVSPHRYKTMQINEALQLQMEVQRRIHEQLEVQKHLQRRIEVQGKYLQSVLEKAQEAFGKQNSGSAGLETAKMQLSELVSKISNECFTSAFPCLEKTHGSHNQQRHVAQILDCSMYSCLTSCEGSQNERETHDSNMVLGAYYHGNLSLGTQEMQENVQLEQIQSGWCEDLNDSKIFSQSMVKDLTQSTLPVSRGFGNLSTSKSEGSRISEVHPRQNDEHNSYLDQEGFKIYAIQQRSLRNSSELELPQLDLNVCDEYNVSKNGNGFDLNGFSWS